jgi:hypothetical protein
MTQQLKFKSYMIHKVVFNMLKTLKQMLSTIYAGKHFRVEILYLQALDLGSAIDI